MGGGLVDTNVPNYQRRFSLKVSAAPGALMSSEGASHVDGRVGGCQVERISFVIFFRQYFSAERLF